MKYKLGDYVRIIQEWNSEGERNMGIGIGNRDGMIGRLIGIRTTEKKEGKIPEDSAFKRGYKYRIKINIDDTDEVVVFKIKKTTDKEMKEYMVDIL